MVISEGERSQTARGGARKKKLSKRLAVGGQIGVHLFAVLPLAWLWLAIPRGLLGGDPVKELIHFLGLGAIRLLLLTLLISPLAKTFKFGALNRLRRPLGLWCFVYASLHFYVWLALDLGFSWSLIGEELIKRNYILIGGAAWIILLALAVTSLPVLMRRMGRHWKSLHKLIYLAAVLTVVHFWWSQKSGWIEPAIYCCLFAVLFWPRRKRLLLG
ncbi:Protein-methionine-sulfoxide reductase heme-binding subunit MsrQ [Thalassocella blandensis]|nr:Protein-methionine-sulfoxide reductase heme-binding subunit MsrQ [Thalassocella blandensis]